MKAARERSRLAGIPLHARCILSTVRHVNDLALILSRACIGRIDVDIKLKYVETKLGVHTDHQSVLINPHFVLERVRAPFLDILETTSQKYVQQPKHDPFILDGSDVALSCLRLLIRCVGNYALCVRDTFMAVYLSILSTILNDFRTTAWEVGLKGKNTSSTYCCLGLRLKLAIGVSLKTVSHINNYRWQPKSSYRRSAATFGLDRDGIINAINQAMLVYKALLKPLSFAVHIFDTHLGTPPLLGFGWQLFVPLHNEPVEIGAGA